MIFADKLISLRKKAGWSQEELAEQMNVTRQSVSKWEGEQSVPELEKIIHLSELFGVSTDYLLKDKIEDYEKPLQEGEYSKEYKENQSVISVIGSAYWSIITAIYLLYSVLTNNWGASWIIWLIGVILCPIAKVLSRKFYR